MLRVLVVDDDADIRNILELALSLSGQFHPTLVDSAAKADVERQRQDFDLVLLDVEMPGTTGPMLLQRWREAQIPLPAVAFLTGHSQPAEITRLMSLGVVGVVVKPFSPVGLEKQLLGMLGQ